VSFFLPGFDPKAMSDDELIARSDELMKKMNFAYRMGGQGADQMNSMLKSIEQERRERLFMERYNMFSSYIAETIETDPDLRDAARAARETAKPTNVKKPRPSINVRRVVPTPTSHPVAPESDHIKPKPQGDKDDA